MEHDVTTASRKVLAPVSGLLEMNTVQQKSEWDRQYVIVKP